MGISATIYDDLKRFMKWLLIISIILAVVSGSTFAYEKISKYFNDKNLISKAEGVVKNQTPAEFTRNDLGETSILKVWNINDSDHHILVSTKNEKAIFSQTVHDTYVTLNKVAGDVCDFGEAGVKNGKVTDFLCDGKIFSRTDMSKK